MDSSQIYIGGASIPELKQTITQHLRELFFEDYFKVVVSTDSNTEADLTLLQHRQIVLQLTINTKEMVLKHSDKLCDSRIQNLVALIRASNKHIWFSRSVVYLQEREVEAFQIANLSCIGVIQGVHGG